jgi:hypothetical protein
MTDDRSPPERPRVEPEIIPPDGRRRPPWQNHDGAARRGTGRIYVTRLGPFGFAMMLLGLAILFAAILVIAIGTVLIWIPVLAVFAVGAAIFGLFRR